ncbi:MAG TPA: asparagine synthase (glutamine-hydrolyzing) [Vicinamibacterales bacterium]|nr:asparagine synthase (glutamine-hydrolyzing) [Vicinamibacterales bacterium]
MCGIVGLFSYGGRADVDERVLAVMRDTMSHRGPDGAGLFVSPDRRLGLAHRRLSILDLSVNGAQPMATGDGRYLVVYNGEIYNFRELREGLEERGQRFSSSSDTEVILALYAREGSAMLKRLRGIFAMGIWDAVERRLWIARDPLGVKPVYYAVHHGQFVFASEIKAILALPGFSRDVDEPSLYHYLSFLASPAPQTLFRGIFKLEPGHTLTVEQDGTLRKDQYWDPFDGVSPERDTDAPERLLTLLRDAVECQMVSDVPFGVFLSGGIDSSANVALMAGLMNEPVQTFSIGFKGQDAYNEFKFARMIAKQYGTNHHELELEVDDLLGFLPSLIHHQDEPIADPVCVPVYFVAKLAKSHGVTVCQVGEGSDELFCGYPYWANVLTAERWTRAVSAVPMPLRALAPATLRAFGYGDTGKYEMVRRSAAGQMLFWGGAEAFTEAQKRRLLHPDLLDRLGAITSHDVVLDYRRQFDERAPHADDALAWMTYLDLRFRLPELLLMRVDKMAMAASVEARVPFLDQELVRFALGVSSKRKLRDGRLKQLLKESVSDILPPAIIDRQKQGFQVPVNEWLLTGIGSTTDEALADFTRAHPYLRSDYKQAFGRPLDGAKTWYLLNLALWHRHWIEQRPMPTRFEAAAANA